MNTYALDFADSFVKPIMDNSVSKVVQFSFPKGKVLEKQIEHSIEALEESVVVLVLTPSKEFDILHK